ncbi:zf-HC2 domain-containing protein [Cellulomonas sp. P24]|uniref:zf-HC2 domain-containing protein n=1 Tax=Cellulomonas sp. P24 TaxID=2885206 RepID=UPI00216ADF00|nr:zf-HC2 domain-containing protein [Cellulomonas sp. P24]MCR6493866.1 zf-HC2 domain-containing protein [Cellulomonas sp. P24]
MTHLGSLTSALVDGQLDPAAAERALAHAAACPRCAAELAAARASRRVLSGIDDVAPAPDLTARLLALGTGADGPGGPGPAGPRFPTASLLAPTQPFPAGGMRGDVMSRHGTRRWVASSVVGVGAAALALFVLGDAHVVAPSDRPAEAMALLSHVEEADTGGVSVASLRTGSSAAGSADTVDGLNLAGGQGAVLAWMHANGWPCPGAFPAGASVTGVRLTGDGVLEVDVDTPRGQFVLTEQRGVLDTALLAGADQVDVGGTSAYVLSRSPWHLAWQSQDTVVEIVSDAGREQVQQVARTIPAAAFDDAAAARIIRGWHTVTGVVAGP